MRSSDERSYFFNVDTNETEWKIAYHDALSDLAQNFNYAWSDNGYHVHADVANHEQEVVRRVDRSLAAWRKASEEAVALWIEVLVPKDQIGEDGLDRWGC